ncbi:MAG: alkaline phosphatase family protein [Candidatus Verstraetearchaeota archaeon]|jgi:predicted AlkP superfamily phosphohydrolase/phosphomutase|nr:alkaline phosphatase family protein [Candidatus Verstraetearchaeota archaeon]
MRKVLVIGLDAASPELVFEKFREDLPNLTFMAENGLYGRLRSCHPPITIPAWMVMVTSINPGRLGLYGFRHRKEHSYTEITLPSSLSVKEKRIWDYIGEAGGKVCLVAIPPTYPPQPVNGWLVSCMMTPDTKRQYTYPMELKSEIESLVGEYIIDVPFRKEERESVLKEIYVMTEKRFKLIKYLLTSKPWNFFMLVEIGLDRIQHAFWKYFDKEHHLYEPGNKFENVIRDYYKYLDHEIGEVMKLVDDDTIIMVVSDHGAKRMKGAFCINEWLIKEGYLKLKEEPKGVVELEKAEVDWNKTIAWAWGGYYARIFINVKGRERNGVVDQRDYESIREQLKKEIEDIRGPNDEKWNTKAYKPEELYPVCNGDPPDLLVYFDDLYWRAAGTIGHNTLYLPENDTGPDDAVHDYDGIFILYDPRKGMSGKVNITIYDVAPTILKLMGLQVPRSMEGKALEEVI